VIKVGLTAASCLLLFLTACGIPDSDATQRLQPFSVEASTNANSGMLSAPHSDELSLGEDLTITVSLPKAFTPTDAAYPKTPRAVAFEMIITNGGTTMYRPSQLLVTATANGATALQVKDSTQGYNGLVGATEDLPPGKNLRVTVAFAVPAERAIIRLTVQPDATGEDEVVVFEGTV
jgi:hypothetical protein